MHKKWILDAFIGCFMKIFMVNIDNALKSHCVLLISDRVKVWHCINLGIKIY